MASASLSRSSQVAHADAKAYPVQDARDILAFLAKTIGICFHWRSMHARIELTLCWYLSMTLHTYMCQLPVKLTCYHIDVQHCWSYLFFSCQKDVFTVTYSNPGRMV